MESPSAQRVARTAAHWGTRPSQLLAVADEVVAFALDEALAAVDDIAQAWASERARGKAGIPPGQRYATDDDYDDAGLPRGNEG